MYMHLFRSRQLYKVGMIVYVLLSCNFRVRLLYTKLEPELMRYGTRVC